MRRPPILRPTRSSARFFRFRVGFSAVIPWCTGLPYTMPCAEGVRRRSAELHCGRGTGTTQAEKTVLMRIAPRLQETGMSLRTRHTAPYPHCKFAFTRKKPVLLRQVSIMPSHTKQGPKAAGYRHGLCSCRCGRFSNTGCAPC